MFNHKLQFAGAALVACSFGAFAQSTTKTTTITQNYTFPPVGVASNETLQVNLSNTASATIATLGAPTAPSCAGTVTVTNAAGAVIGKANPFTVAAGVIQSITVPYASLGATGSARAEVLVSVQRTLTVPSPVACSLIYSLETYLTTTGETHLLLGNTATTGIVPVLTGVISPVPPVTVGTAGGN